MCLLPHANVSVCITIKMHKNFEIMAAPREMAGILVSHWTHVDIRLLLCIFIVCCYIISTEESYAHPDLDPGCLLLPEPDALTFVTVKMHSAFEVRVVSREIF